MESTSTALSSAPARRAIERAKIARCSASDRGPSALQLSKTAEKLLAAPLFSRSQIARHFSPSALKAPAPVEFKMFITALLSDVVMVSSRGGSLANSGKDYQTKAAPLLLSDCEILAVLEMRQTLLQRHPFPTATSAPSCLMAPKATEPVDHQAGRCEQKRCRNSARRWCRCRF
jgi:hypothetical protein